MKLLLGSVLFGAKHAAPVMKANGGGSIINNASIAGMRSGYGPAVYSAAKAAVIQLTITLAMELAPARIRVNAISPGTIETPIFGRVLGLNEEKIQQTLHAVGEALKDVGQLGRVGVPEDIAQAAVYLASDESSFVTGHNLLVDGGAIMGRSAQGFLEALGSLGEAAKM
jgi:NAD(P)-dependent dehydrogenase (short-subunit alcohol dehydrogenase family)